MCHWIEKSNETVLDSKWLKIEKKAFAIEDGIEVPEYYIINNNDSALCVCYLESKNQFVLIRQYRPGIEKNTICHPGGRLEDKDNSIIDGALRELLEETGFTPYNTVALGKFAQIPAIATAHVHLFLVFCSSTNKLTPSPDPTEDLEIITIEKDNLISLINSGKMDCIACIAASYRALDLLDKSANKAINSGN